METRWILDNPRDYHVQDTLFEEDYNEWYSKLPVAHSRTIDKLSELNIERWKLQDTYNKKPFLIKVMDTLFEFNLKYVDKAVNIYLDNVILTARFLTAVLIQDELDYVLDTDELIRLTKQQILLKYIEHKTGELFNEYYFREQIFVMLYIACIESGQVDNYTRYEELLKKCRIERKYFPEELLVMAIASGENILMYANMGLSDSEFRQLIKDIPKIKNLTYRLLLVDNNMTMLYDKH